MEVGEPSTKRAQFQEALNDKDLAMELDLIDEVRDYAQVQEEACKRRATQKYASRLKRRELWVDDLVWRINDEARKNPTKEKLSPN